MWKRGEKGPEKLGRFILHRSRYVFHCFSTQNTPVYKGMQ